jgi:DNA-binding response OmpR family regulator
VTILIVEDERPIAQVLADNLEYEGHTVRCEHDGRSGLEAARADDLDLILLDLMLPGISGYEVCMTLREEGVSTPIIMLTAKGEEIDKVMGLDLGADDYMTKPVGIRELLARIRAVTRRSEPGAQTCVTFGDAEVDFERFEARMRGVEVRISPKAFGLMKLLIESGGRALSRSDILEDVWGMDVFPTTRTVDNHIAELRGALETDPANPVHFLTVHGVGYRFSADR